MPFRNRLDAKKLSRSRQLEELSFKDGFRQCIYNGVYDKYTGDWKKDRKTGMGAMLTRKNEYYEGEFLNNYRHGSGILALYLPKFKVFSLQYQGDWKFGRMNGHGLRSYFEEGFYIGKFENGKRHGYGQMWYSNGSFYDGEWAKDKREGLGMLVSAVGNRYEGAWLDDKKHGSGRLYFLNVGQIQIGTWKHGICIFSIIRNLPFRQAAVAPTPYPLPINTLVNLEQITLECERLAKADGQESADNIFIEDQTSGSINSD